MSPFFVEALSFLFERWLKNNVEENNVLQT